MKSREISIAFAEAFCACDLVRLESLLAPEFHLRGPLFSFESRDDYLESLRENPPEPGECAILQVHGAEQEAAILYEYRKPHAPLLVAQFNRLSRNLISEIRLVFDTAQMPHASWEPGQTWV